MALLVLKLEDLFFDSVLAYQTENQDIMTLAQTMGATHGLVFDSRVPPVIKQNDTVGSGKVKPDTTSLETDQEDGDGLIGLE